MATHPEDLEQNLRSMILGNIRITGPDEKKPPPPPAAAGAAAFPQPWTAGNGRFFEHNRGHSGSWHSHDSHHGHRHDGHPHRAGFDDSPHRHGPPRGGRHWDHHHHQHDDFHHRGHGHGHHGHGHGGHGHRGGFHSHHHAPPGLPTAPIPGAYASPADHAQMSHFRGGRGEFRGGRGPRGRGTLYQPGPINRTPTLTLEELNLQSAHLQAIADAELPSLQMSDDEFKTKDAFRGRLEGLCQAAAAAHYSSDPASISLQAFGSFASAFGLPGSDMDLAMIAPHLPDLPRVVEKALLDVGIGARLLSRTRVPILKICESPTPELYAALLEERTKWDAMTPEEREVYDRGPRKADDKDVEKAADDKDVEKAADDRDVEKPRNDNSQNHDEKDTQPPDDSINLLKDSQTPEQTPERPTPANDNAPTKDPDTPDDSTTTTTTTTPKAKPRRDRPWAREKKASPLDFPKSPPNAVGIQCDINFSTTLGLHNTALLTCYGAADPRVRPLVLLVKRWAARRKINSGYSGTLSSYGFVLMLLHFLVNVAAPPVCPNLQLAATHAAPPARAFVPPDPAALVDGCDVRFWRSAPAIRARAARGLLTHNRDPLGRLLRNFFVYYAWQGGAAPRGGFAWTHDVLSLRSPGGLLGKPAKGWTGARTTLTPDDKEVRHRYLLAIEDPFELEHNVARTVTHYGIVAIRDEFRRAARILERVGKGLPSDDGDLFDLIVEKAAEPEAADADAGTDATDDKATAPTDTKPAAATA